MQNYLTGFRFYVSVMPKLLVDLLEDIERRFLCFVDSSFL